MLNVTQLEDDVWCNLKNNRDGNSVGQFVQLWLLLHAGPL